MSNTCDTYGRPWAKLSGLREGDRIELDDGFTCHDAGIVELKRDDDGLYFECAGPEDEPDSVDKPCHHYLDGQADDGEHLVGIYGPVS